MNTIVQPGAACVPATSRHARARDCLSSSRPAPPQSRTPAVENICSNGASGRHASLEGWWHRQKAMGAASVSEVTLLRRLPDVLPVWDIIITAPPSAVIGD
jgi:hypothetical protein